MTLFSELQKASPRRIPDMVVVRVVSEVVVSVAALGHHAQRRGPPMAPVGPLARQPPRRVALVAGALRRGEARGGRGSGGGVGIRVRVQPRQGVHGLLAAVLGAEGGPQRWPVAGARGRGARRRRPGAGHVVVGLGWSPLPHDAYCSTLIVLHRLHGWNTTQGEG